jgi:CDP-glycerol glycerophosphotransferase
MSPALSVIVTSYNIEDYVERALTSVLEQDFADSEIVFIDDGSTDRSLKRAARLLKSVPNARLIAQANGGPGAARNAALAQCSGDYVVYLDGDDWYAPGAFALLWAEVKDTPADIVLSNRQRYFEGKKQYDDKIGPFFAKRRGTVAELPEVLNVIGAPSKLFRRQFLVENAITFPVGMSSEDFVFSYNAYRLAQSVSIVPELTYIIRRRKKHNSLTQERLSEFNLVSRFRQIEMTQEIVNTTTMAERFPGVDFKNDDYDQRLMRHVKVLATEQDPAVREAAMALLRTFIERHRREIFGAIRETIKPVYEAILAGDTDKVVALCRALYPK